MAQRVGARYAQRGEPMTLRVVSALPGPVPYPNPPNVSGDLVVATGVTSLGHAYLGITGSSIIGRLVAGDLINTLDSMGNVLVTWTVGTMPDTILTNSDGIAEAAMDGTPVVGSPTIYNADSLAANDAWLVIPVSAPGAPDPVASIGDAVSFVFQADASVFGTQMSRQRMISIGWVEVDTIGLSIAGYNAGAVARPKVNDKVVMLDGTVRAIINSGDISRNGTEFLYQVQVR